MTTSKCVVMKKPMVMEIAQLPLPTIGEEDGLLRVEACGLCGTDCSQHSGDLPTPSRIILGHEIVGTIVQLGGAAARRHGVAVGDRVAVEVFKSCRECVECRRGSYLRCERHGIADMYGFYGTRNAPGLWGGYSEYLYLDRDAVLLKVPAAIRDPVFATLFNPLGAGVRWARTLGGVKAGDVVVVMGPGIRGLCCVIVAKMAGARFVMVTGLGATDADRMETARRFGADCVVDVAKEDPADVLEARAGTLADVVVDVTSHAPAALAQSISLVRTGGTIVVAAMRASTETPDFVPDLLVTKEVRLQGALGVDRPAYSEALTILATTQHTLPWQSISRRIASFDDIQELLLVMSGKSSSSSSSSSSPAPMHGVFVPYSANNNNVATPREDVGPGWVSLLPPQEALARCKEVGISPYMGALNIFRTLLHQPQLAKGINDSLMSILLSEHLDMRLRELIIMRLGWRTGSHYEWTQHWEIALRLGVPDDVLLCMRLSPDDVQQRHAILTDADRAVVAAVDDVLELGAISEHTWQRCVLAIPSEPARVEMVVAIGLWRMISSTARSLRIPVEDRHEKRWPPDGVAPARSLL